jgi:hypothetical protein
MESQVEVPVLATLRNNSFQVHRPLATYCMQYKAELQLALQRS